MRNAVNLYYSHKYNESIIVLNQILNENDNYITPKYYLMLDYFQLGWYEMAIKMAESIINYYEVGSDKKIVISYILKVSHIFLSTNNKRNGREKVKDLKIDKYIRGVLNKYAIK